MLQRVTVACGEGQDAYLVNLMGKNLRNVFENARESPAIKGKRGEDRVAAIIALGGVEKLERRKNRQRHDGPNGEPGAVLFNENGARRAVRHFINGKLHDDMINGEMAAFNFDRSGATLIYAAHFDMGKRTKLLTEQEMAAYPTRLNGVAQTFKPRRPVQVAALPALSL